MRTVGGGPVLVVVVVVVGAVVLVVATAAELLLLLLLLLLLHLLMGRLPVRVAGLLLLTILPGLNTVAWQEGNPIRNISRLPSSNKKRKEGEKLSRHRRDGIISSTPIQKTTSIAQKAETGKKSKDNKGPSDSQPLPRPEPPSLIQ